MPRSFFGRALLILLFPVVVLQLVIGLVFIQRHFEQVTTQMARSVALELNYAADVSDRAESIGNAQVDLFTLGYPFNMRLNLMANETVVPDMRRYFYDLSGRALIASLQKDIKRPIAIDLTENFRKVRIQIQTNKGMLVAVVPRSRVSASNPHQLLVLMVAVSIILTVISVLFLRNQVRPIRKLAQVSEAFGKGRIEHYRPSGATEIRRAGYSFLAMRARLERQIEQRTQMLSGVSHDLRTPLTRMKLSLALLDNSEEVKLLGKDVDDMEQMLDEFLAFARGDSLEETLPTDPIVLVEKITADCRRAGYNVEYTHMNTTDGPATTIMRPTAVARAISNLVSNAARYATKTLIHVQVTQRNLHISVSDNGPGIPVEERDAALKPFVRLDPSRNPNETGVGLGLAITVDIARSHGGKLVLGQSEKLGGLKATFTIPR